MNTYRMTQQRRTRIIDAIMRAAANYEGKSRARCLTRDDASAWIDTMRSNPDANTVRIYADGGDFVPNSYKWGASITCIDKGLLGMPLVHRVDAHRRNGCGAALTINGRGI